MQTPLRFNPIAYMPIFIALALCFSMPSFAEQKKTLGAWDVHYMVLPTTFLSPEVASANNITRSKYSALINISVLDKKTQKAQDLEVRGEARNLLGNTKPLSFKQVKDGEAIYYLATVNFDDKETLRFSIDIDDKGSKQLLTFQQLMYAD